MVHSPAQTFKYRTPEDKEEKSNATELIQQRLLTASFVQEVMEAVVTRFFVFRASDLREWEEEPEEWEKREEGDGEDWEFSLRSCSEKLFLDLAINYKDLLVQPLLQVFYTVATADNEDVLFKDSVYTAIGLAAPVLAERLDFDAFIRDVLVAEVQKQRPGFNILRRRAAILLGQWISVKVSERQLVYQLFQFLLDNSDALNDQVVRVTAGRQFSKIVDDWETRPDELQVYVEVIITRLMALIDEVELTETKMALLNTISVIVERMEHRITPFAVRIVNVLPKLWEASGEEHLMKQAILTIFARLINAMKAASGPLHEIVLPIIGGAVQPGSDNVGILLEDAMDLWASVLATMSQPTPEILELLPRLFAVYELGSEQLRKALEITESYLLLAPFQMLSESARQPLIAALASLFGALKGKPEANGIVCNLVELVIRQAQKVGGAGLVEDTASDLVKSGFMKQLIVGLHGSWTAHCTTGPLAKHSPVDGVVETDYFAILARLILTSLDAFRMIIEETDLTYVESSGEPPHEVLNDMLTWLLEEWFSHFETIGDPSRRKLMALALTKLLETAVPVVMLSLQSMMTVWTDVVTELREATETLVDSDDSLMRYPEQQPPGDPHEAFEDARRREMSRLDDVHTLSLPWYVQDGLGSAIAAAGGEEAFQERWLANVDRDVLNAFMRLDIM
ncbi:hypothetical protein LTR53_016636 [Teratosphaeriaceae sp. CCFEE 6253]|nr:hypothetical protein LTR53_016636 [Teratosphaeriaceae sp. CCFEE 6253]